MVRTRHFDRQQSSTQDALLWPVVDNTSATRMLSMSTSHCLTSTRLSLRAWQQTGCPVMHFVTSQYTHLRRECDVWTCVSRIGLFSHNRTHQRSVVWRLSPTIKKCACRLMLHTWTSSLSCDSSPDHLISCTGSTYFTCSTVWTFNTFDTPWSPNSSAACTVYMCESN